MFLMRIYHKIQMTFFQNFDLVNIKENSKNGYGIMVNNRTQWIQLLAPVKYNYNIANLSQFLVIFSTLKLNNSITTNHSLINLTFLKTRDETTLI